MDREPRPEGSPPSPDPPPSPERTSGLTLETCYRHQDVYTGVHCTRCGRPICPDCMHQAAVGHHCPECVAEARRSGRRRALVLGGPRSVTSVLMAVNVGLFLVTAVLGSAGRMFLGGRTATLVDLGALQPLLIARDGQYWRLVTAIFLHAGLFHLLFNMWALYLFGNLIERALGPLRFLAIYLVSGFLASVASFLFSNPLAVGVGASGAIFGLLGAWVAYNLRRRGTAMASANLRTAAVIIAINVIFGLSVAGIDNFAHLGGLAAGVVLGWLAEGAGPRSVRPLVQAAGFAAVILVGVVLTVARAGALAA